MQDQFLIPFMDPRSNALANYHLTELLNDFQTLHKNVTFQTRKTPANHQKHNFYEIKWQNVLIHYE